jgi:hypothetical protein
MSDKLPSDAAARKALPIATGVLDYFPDALAAVAHCSRVGNDQHNPGQPLHWSKGKSTDHADCLVRHLIQRGTVDSDGVRHAAKVAWRALALLQTELDAALDSTPVVDALPVLSSKHGPHYYPDGTVRPISSCPACCRLEPDAPATSSGQ